MVFFLEDPVSRRDLHIDNVNFKKKGFWGKMTTTNYLDADSPSAQHEALQHFRDHLYANVITKIKNNNDKIISLHVIDEEIEDLTDLLYGNNNRSSSAWGDKGYGATQKTVDQSHFLISTGMGMDKKGEVGGTLLGIGAAAGLAYLQHKKKKERIRNLINLLRTFKNDVNRLKFKK